MQFTTSTRLRNWAFVLCCTGTFFACQKNLSHENGTATEPKPDLVTTITTPLVSGFVTDENEAAVKSATVEVGAITVSTDKYGYFEVKNALVVQNAAVVTVSRPGYFKAIKTYIGAAGKNAFFRIKLLPKTNTGNFNGAGGGSVTLSNGLKIELPAAAVVNASTNVAYTGTVNVAAQLISAVNTDLNRIMPGDLRGLNSDNNLRILTTYGMAAIELTGAGGELLQIASGKKAILTMPIPTTLQGTAPASIPLWYFDESKGLWKEEGSAARSGNNYVGEVSHFSFWNYDVPANYVQFNCTLVTQGGQPVQNAFVRITVINSNASAWGYTDNNGYTGGAVPNNSQLRLDVYSSYSCNNVLYTQTFTTTNINLSLGTLTVNTSSVFATLTGTVTSCANTPVTNGYIIVQSGNQNFRYPVTNGNFNFTSMLCTTPSTVSVIAEDVTNLQQSTPASITLNAGNNTLGNIQACGVAVQQYTNYSINGTTYSYTPPLDSLLYNNVGSYVSFFGYRTNANSSFFVNFTSAGLAAGSGQDLTGFSVSQITDSLRATAPITVNITEYGAVGQYVSGNFTGTFTGNPPVNTPYNITLNFRTRRNN
jgi:hypothetical protein